MGDMLETDRSLIEPVYSQTEPSAPIDLGLVRAEFECEGKTYAGSARVTMRFTPDERLCFEIPVKDKPFGLLISLFDDDWDGRLRLPERQITLDVLWVSTTVSGENAGAILVPKTSVVTVTPSTDDLTTATFHLFNFPEFHGPEDYNLTTGASPHRKWKRCGRAILKADGWNITIAATDRTADLCKALGAQGGFMITHMGRIERDDGSPFSSEQLDDLLHCLHYFLSLALGRWAGVALPIGLDAAGSRGFEQWGTPMIASEPWNGSCSWFDTQHGGLLCEVFPGFMVLWKDETWNRPIKEALYWYLAANERGTGIGVDTGLILAQTALERLAWTYCVQHRKMISAEAFEPRGLSAADKLRLLTGALDIPADIPACLSALHAKRGRKWDDGMHGITEIRNTVVHPHAKQQLPDGSYYEAWKLSLWYLDMVFLRLCGHRGSYGNRLESRWKGQVEPVPWAQARKGKKEASPPGMEAS